MAAAYAITALYAARSTGLGAGLAVAALAAALDAGGRHSGADLAIHGLMEFGLFSMAVLLVWRPTESRSEPAPAVAPAAPNNVVLSHVSHELRTPLAAAKLYVGLVADGIQGPVNAEQADSLKGVTRNLDQLERMIANLVEAARAEAGEVRVDLRPLDLAPLAAQALKAVARTAGDRGVRLADEVPSGLPRVKADGRLVAQVLAHLLDNAVKFSPEGGTVRLGARADGSGSVRVSVADAGPGVAPEDRERIFHKLSEMEELDDSSRKGLGLGLHLARILVERQGGRIWVESEPGRGSTFHFTLPATREEA